MIGIARRPSSVGKLKPPAAVAELVYAHGSGPCGRKPLGVQVPPAALNIMSTRMRDRETVMARSCCSLRELPRPKLRKCSASKPRPDHTAPGPRLAIGRDPRTCNGSFGCQLQPDRAHPLDSTPSGICTTDQVGAHSTVSGAYEISSPADLVSQLSIASPDPSDAPRRPLAPNPFAPTHPPASLTRGRDAP